MHTNEYGYMGTSYTGTDIVNIIHYGHHHHYRRSSLSSSSSLTKFANQIFLFVILMSQFFFHSVYLQTNMSFYHVSKIKHKKHTPVQTNRKIDGMEKKYNNKKRMNEYHYDYNDGICCCFFRALRSSSL